jgi:hypothetical protein
VTDESRFEEDRPTYDESKYVTGAQLSDYINQKLGVTVDSANNRLIFTRSLLSEGYVGSQYAGGGTPTWLDMLPVASTAAKGIAQFDANQFSVTNGVVSILDSVVKPDLGIPATDGYLLSSTADGVRSWVAPYSHPKYTSRNLTANQGQVISNFTSNGEGHVTGISLRSLSAVDIPNLAISQITNLQSSLDSKLDKSGGTISGSLTVNSLVVNGDIVQNGATYETHAQQVYTANDLIITRDGAVAGLGAGEVSGFKVLMADGSHNLIFGAGNDAVARIGWENDALQAIATREDSPTSGGLAIWNDTASRFDTTLSPSVVSLTVGNALMSWDGSKMVINKSLHITGDFTASGRVGSQVAAAISSSLWDLLPVADPISKTVDNAVTLKYGNGLKLDTNGNLVIDGDVFNLNNYYDKTTADGRFVNQSTTVAGKALTSNISLASSDLTDGGNLAKTNVANQFGLFQTISSNANTNGWRVINTNSPTSIPVFSAGTSGDMLLNFQSGGKLRYFGGGASDLFAVDTLGNTTITGNLEAYNGTTFQYIAQVRDYNSNSYRAAINSSGGAAYFSNYNKTTATSLGLLRIRENGNLEHSPDGTNYYVVWHKGNDGIGSTLDSDLLDGQHGSYYTDVVSRLGYTPINKTGDNNIGSLRASGYDSFLSGFIAGHNPEGNILFNPMMYNDLTFLRKRGYAITSNTGGLSDGIIDVIFNGSSQFANISSSTFPITLEFDTPAFSYGTWMGISFGNGNWVAKSVKIEAYSENTWKTIVNTTNNTSETVMGSVPGNSSTGTRKMRVTLDNANTSSVRITHIFAYNYSSHGLGNIYVPRGGGDMYDSLSINEGWLNITNSGTSKINVASTGDGNALAYFDAINGDFTGGDYVYLGQRNDGDFLINHSTKDVLTIDPSGNFDLNGDVGINGSIASTNFRSGNQIRFTRNSASYIWADTPGGFLSFGVNGNAVGTSEAGLYIDSSNNVYIKNGNLNTDIINSLGGMNVTAPSTPFTFYESGNSNDWGRKWRQVLDSGNLRFDIVDASTGDYDPLIYMMAGGGNNQSYVKLLYGGGDRVVTTSAGVNITGSAIVSSSGFFGSTSRNSDGVVRITSNDSHKAGFEAYGASQGTGYLFVGQSSSCGGGIEYNGDNSPTTTGAGADYIALWRRANGTDYWTARNNYNSNDWEFRGNVTINGIKLERAAININGWSGMGLKVNGGILSTGAMGTQYASDRRIKTDLKEILPEEALRKVVAIKAYRYTRKDIEVTEIGNIAQDVEKVEPLLVSTTELMGYKDFKTLSYERQSVLHGPAIQALYAKIQELEAEVKRLKNEKAA